MNTDLEGRRILVTGASGGIGAATCHELAGEGAQIVVHYRGGASRAAAVVEELERLPGCQAHAIGADLRAEDQVESLFAAAVERFGAVDGLVVNAGIWPECATPLADLPLDQWRDTVAVNLTGAFLCCRAFLRQLRAAGAESGSIVLVGSTAGIYGEEGHGDYAATKSALVGLMLTLKNEIVRIAPRGRVNLVHPGWVATPMARSALEDRSMVSRVTSTMALRKVAAPEDVARAIVFLLSDRLAGHLSGTVMPIAGGMEGRLIHP